MAEKEYEIYKKEMEMRTLEIHAETLREIIWERYKFFPLIATFSMATLSLFAINPIIFNFYVKILITGFLLLTLISPWFYMYELHRSEKYVLEKFDLDVTNEIARKRTFSNKITSYMPHFLMTVFSLLIILTGVFIWNIVPSEDSTNTTRNTTTRVIPVHEGK